MSSNAPRCRCLRSNRLEQPLPTSANEAMKEVPLPLFSITHNKLEPIYRFCRLLIGRRRGRRHNTPPFCEMWIGTSAEENARRCKPSHEGGSPTATHCASWG